MHFNVSHAETEGALLETIRRAIAKIIGEDDLSILRVTGGNQVGRNRFSLPGSDFPESKRQTNPWICGLHLLDLDPAQIVPGLWPDPL